MIPSTLVHVLIYSGTLAVLWFAAHAIVEWHRRRLLRRGQPDWEGDRPCWVMLALTFLALAPLAIFVIEPATAGQYRDGSPFLLLVASLFSLTMYFRPAS